MAVTGRVVLSLLWACLALAGASRHVAAQPAPLLAPPRTIADVTAILDQQKPDPNAVTQLQAAANAPPPEAADRAALAWFYYKRGQARLNLGRIEDSLEDARRAIDNGRGAIDPIELGLLLQFLGFQLTDVGKARESLEVFLEIERSIGGAGAEARLANTYRHLVTSNINLGHLEEAAAYVRKADALIEKIRASGKITGYLRASAESDTAAASANLAEARGNFADAVTFFRRAEQFRRDAAQMSYPTAPPRSQQERAADIFAIGIGQAEAHDGKIAEGEFDIRRALLNRLRAGGKYNLATARFIGYLSSLMLEQGRFGDAEKLARSELEIEQAFHLSEAAQNYAETRARLAAALALQDRWAEAEGIYTEIEAATRGWEPARRARLVATPERVIALYGMSKDELGIAAARQLLERRLTAMGEDHFETALARGLLAVGLSRAGRESDSLGRFTTAVSALLARSRETDQDDAESIGAREQRVRFVIENYVAALAHEGSSSGIGAATGFRAIESIRGLSVQRALEQSSARTLAFDPALAELVRRDQDLDKQVSAQLVLLNRVLALSVGERDEKGIRELMASIAKLQLDRNQARSRIERLFPDYAALVDPKPPSIDEVRATLVDGEAMLSFYFGRSTSFVWAIPKTGTAAFASIDATSTAIGQRVRKLRHAVEAEISVVSDIPSFDLKLAYELYSMLLKPVEASWKPSKNLIVVTNGALGLLPLSLLPTAPAEISRDDDPLFASYRNVPWLARTHAVTMVPSSAAFRMLRALPPPRPGRSEFVGFGDPLFSAEQAANAARERGGAAGGAPAAKTRGPAIASRAGPKLDGVDAATLARLPRLPDTADELRSIALALRADPAKVLYLGKDANKRVIRTTDLSHVKVVAFATHGLVPGELDGLTQPALALTAPEVAGIEGTGLLTMGEILSLKLDADWVVLSACNTAAGESADAEAASGLGRAFFYAGTRAILVTNWSVDSGSAKGLVTDLFRRQAENPGLTRAEALRQAMMSLVDGKGYVDSVGQTQFTFAHPWFWAPYSIIGDGGRPSHVAGGKPTNAAKLH